MKDNEGVAARVGQALTQSGLSQSDVARQAQQICPKASRAIFHNAVKHGARPRSVDVRSAFAQVLGVDPAWLWYGAKRRTPSMLRDELLHDEGDEGTTAPAEGSAVPVVLAVRPDPAAYLVPVTNKAWEPIASPGDCLYISPSYPPVIGDRVYLKSAQGEGLYRLLDLSADGFTLLSPIGLQTVLPRDGLVLHRVGGIAYA
ncbi:MAG: hypothetical protein NVV74_21405 [Magnetospirillum sp.]|nr:hypothetical protein [Magnetospirillum sp.]